MKKFFVNVKEDTLLPPQKTQSGAVEILIRPAVPLSTEVVSKLNKIKNWI